MQATQPTTPDVIQIQDLKLNGFSNMYGCEIGRETKIEKFVEIQSGAKIGSQCQISSHSFICEGVTIEDAVFIGQGVIFVNDLKHKAINADGTLNSKGHRKGQRTLIKKGASIGSASIILSGVTIGENAHVGSGSVVTTDVPPDSTVTGNPAA